MKMHRVLGLVLLPFLCQVSSVCLAEPTPAAVTPVSACKALTLDEIRSVYPNYTFKTVTDRNDPPHVYEALSACRYEESDKELFERYHIDLEVRAKPSAADARSFLASSKEMDYDKKGKTLSGFGDDAYLMMQSMAYGGPSIQMVKGSVYYKLTIQTIKAGSFKGIEQELLALAKLVL